MDTEPKEDEDITDGGFVDDVEAIKISLEGSYYAVCCFGAVIVLLMIHGSWD